MDDKRALIVLNPHAGRGRAGRLATALPARARALGWDTEVRQTRHAGQEVELGASAQAERWPLVIAVGGDGTVHGVANGLLAGGPSDTVLGHVPIGTGNDFAKTVGLDKARRPERNLERILGGRVRPLDVGRVGDELFVNSGGVGFGPEVVKRTREFTRLRGFPLYFAAVLRAFFSFQPPELVLASAEHSEQGRALLLEASIGRTAGGGFWLTPNADPTDGLLDVCVVHEIGRLTFLRYLPRVMRGTHTQLQPVTMFRTRRLEIETPSMPLVMHLDGELRRFETSSVVIDILPGHLKALCATGAP